MSHRSVGAIIKKNGKYLMIDRVNKPLGWACVAGHIDEGETPEEALVREVKEESNLDVAKFKMLLHEFVAWNVCRRNVTGHDWHVYECECSGEVKIDNSEAKSYMWFTREELRNLGNLQEKEGVWDYFFNKLGIL